VSEKPIFNVAGLLKEPLGATRTARVDATLEDLSPDLRVELDQREASVQITGPVRLMHVTDGVLVQGSLYAQIAVPCIRCLEPATLEVDIDVEETFAPTVDMATGQLVTPEEDDRALWIDEHHILDLSEVLRQDLLLAIPVHVVCRDDCKGLCATCGQNLNEGDCECVAEIDPRWSALRGLLDDSTQDNQSS
jgi:uncharacterized protein